jgi:hypothetical protein
MGLANINVQFTEEEFETVLMYQKVSEAVTVQAAILNAISLALDHDNWLDDEIASIDDGN